MPQRSDANHRSVTRTRLGLGGFVLRLKAAMLVLLWLALFGAGVLMPSQAFRNMLLEPPLKSDMVRRASEEADPRVAAARHPDAGVQPDRPTQGHAEAPSSDVEVATIEHETSFSLAAVHDDLLPAQNGTLEDRRPAAASTVIGASGSPVTVQPDAAIGGEAVADGTHNAVIGPNRLRWHLSRDAMLAFVLSFATYTPTNLALLCCFAAVMGSISRRMRDHGKAQFNSRCPACRQRKEQETSANGAANAKANDADERQPNEEKELEQNVIAGSMLRGLCIFLMVISGLIVLTGDPFVEVSQEKYLRLAGAASLFAFVAGFNRHVLPTIISSNRHWSPTHSK